MDLVTEYILTHSDGEGHPVSGASIARALSISGVQVRKLINTARSNGNPICSNAKGYYIAMDKEAVQRTVDSLKSRIAAMTNASNGLEKFVRGVA